VLGAFECLASHAARRLRPIHRVPSYAQNRIGLSPLEKKPRPGYRTMDVKAQAKALRLRMYVLCSVCARLIDLAEGNRQQREVEGADLIQHVAEEHAAWLEVLGIDK
jgi:hypothetical protein